MRRSLILAVAAALLAGLGVTAVTLATDDTPDEPAAQRAGVGTLLAAQAGGGLPDPQAVFRSYAQRLGVNETRLRVALERVGDTSARTALDRAVRDGAITDAQRDALRRCHEDRARCDTAQLRDLKRELERTGEERLEQLDLGALKGALAGDLASELQTTDTAVVAATRAELAGVLEGVVRSGLLTTQVRDRALGCFDDPEACDLDALRREIPMLDALPGGLGQID
ncbi:MAG: hypothetical protein H0U79_07180 [Solirubrobacterales bacterium]|nr:hypothetical protein [Solirubrobacterales bacterium]